VLWQAMDAPTRQTPLSSIGQHQESPMSITLCRSLRLMGRQLTRSLLVLLITAALLAACGGSEAPLPSPPPVATYTVSTAAGGGGAITPASASAQAGANASFSLVPDAGFELVGASGCNGTLDAAAGTYTTGGVTADCTVTVQFAALPAATAQVTGVALDTAGRSLAGVQAYNADGVLATSDAQGRLSFDLPPSAAGAVRLRKAGYTRQTVMLDVVNAKASFVGTLGRRNAPVTINIDTNVADLLGGSGARVTLSPGTVVDAQGNPVTGDFQVTVTPVDVSDSATRQAFPGSYAALDMAGEPVPILMPYGTMEVLLTRGDEALNLSPGAVAAIEIPIYVTQYNDGTPIAVGDTGGEVWSLTEDTGLWQLEGTGVVVAAERSPTGLALRTQVSHFSWYNFDYQDRVREPDGTLSSGCRVPVTMINLPPGAQVVGDLSLIGDVDGPEWEDTFLLELNERESIRIPRSRQVRIFATAYVIGPSGTSVYFAGADFSCGDVDAGITLNFNGPAAPVIQYYDASIHPVFALDANGLNEVVANRAEARWTVVGQTFLNLIEPELPLNRPLNVAHGSLDIALFEPADPASDRFNFKLVAGNDAGAVELQESLAYITASPPVLSGFGYTFVLSQPLQMYWAVEGEDEVTVGYVPIGAPPTPMTVLATFGSGALSSFSLPANALPNQGVGYEIVVEFKNRYGSIYRQFTFGECFQNADGTCADTD
jgi:hypothetical protein